MHRNCLMCVCINFACIALEDNKLLVIIAKKWIKFGNLVWEKKRTKLGNGLSMLF